MPFDSKDPGHISLLHSFIHSFDQRATIVHPTHFLLAFSLLAVMETELNEQVQGSGF